MRYIEEYIYNYWVTPCSLAIISEVFDRWQPLMEFRAADRGAASFKGSA